MKLVVNGIKMPVCHTEGQVFEKAEKQLEKCKITAEKPYIYKKSIDARRKSDIHFVYSVAFETKNIENKVLSDGIKVLDEPSSLENIKISTSPRILVVGSGPAGLFAAYTLALGGAKVTLVERGQDVENRKKTVEYFHKTGILNPESNIQFGEGGAGTFSDGKLNTRISSPFQRFVLETFVRCGAPKEILYDAKPHIGTDYLGKTVKNLREEIRALGAQVLFDTCLTDIVVKNEKITGAVLNGSSYIDCDAVVLAIGHSSRDTYKMLYEKGIFMEQKPFAAGVRIEHTRGFINRMQYGDCPFADKLPTADYRLVHNGDVRSVYSFCMCPGGTVVNASSEEGHLCVNGMSEHARMADNSNSALVVSVRPEDFSSASPLAGIEFQRRYEGAAYRICGGKGVVQLAKDFVRDRVSDSFGDVKPSFTGEVQFADLRECLPQFIADTLKEGILEFDKKIKGFSGSGAILTGVEMRTSAPLRIKRDEKFESISHKGLYPCGEGAGYAGGIMSAAVDGIRVAQAILKRWE